MAARILKISSAVPGAPVHQDELWEDLYRDFYRDVPNAADVFKASSVITRHVAWDPRKRYVGAMPAMGERMRAWEENVLSLGAQTAGIVLAAADTADVGSFALASCTGYAGPTPEMLLAKELGLPPTLRRTLIGHMGCYAAFNALKVALDAIAARPDELALVTCCEICSVHVRPEMTTEQVIVNSLFADASASVLLGPDDGNGPALLRTYTETHYHASDAMTWTVEDDAFRMTLSPYVPAILAEAVGPFVTNLLAPLGLTRSDVQHWGIHPGGPKIIDFVGDRLGIDEDGLAPSRRVLATRGNCSSATILLVLEQIMANNSGQRPTQAGDIGVLMAFGPGLTMESAVVRF